MMDSDDEIVETSDVEELAQLAERRVAKLPKPLDSRDFNTYSPPEDSFSPRKKMKLFHEDDEQRGLFVSPAKSLSTNRYSPRRSQSSSTMFATTSPVHLVTSRSPTQIPDQICKTPARKLEARMSMPSSPVQVHSQGPLLHSATKLRPTSISLFPDQTEFAVIDALKDSNFQIEQTTSSTSSPPGSRSRSRSSDLLYLFGPSPVQTPSSNPASGPSRIASEGPAEDNVDDLLVFTPVKPTLEHIRSSPSTPTSPKSSSQASIRKDTHEARKSRSASQTSAQSVTPELQRSRSPSPTVGPVPAAQHELDASLALALNEQRQESRYHMRARKPAQVNPYKAERIIYRTTLKNIPDAIVEVSSDRRRHRHPDDHYEEEEETKEDEYAHEAEGRNEEDASSEEQEGRRKRHGDKRRRIEAETSAEARRASSEREREPVQYPGILQDDLSATDEDVQKARGATLREGRKVQKEQERKKKSQEKEERRRRQEEELYKAKRFPLAKPTSVAPKSSTSSKRLRSSLPNHEDEDDDEVAVLDDKSSASRRSPEIPRAHRNLGQAEPSSSTQVDPIRDYFAEDEDFGMYDQGDPEDTAGPIRSRHSSPASPNGFLGHSYETAMTVESDHDDNMGSETERRSESPTNTAGIKIDLPPKHTRALERMMPKFMIGALAKKDLEAVAAAKTKKRRAVEENDSENTHSGPLLPGQTRVQLAAKGKDVREIKGDSESELDISMDSDSSSSSSSGPSHPGHAERADSEESDVDDILTVYRHRTDKKFQKSRVIDVDEFDHAYPDGVIDDDEIEVISHRKAKKKGAMARLRDPSAIDYMLARPTVIGGTRKHSMGPEAGIHREGSSSGYKLDVMTKGAKGYGRGRQALLSFDNHRSDKKKGSRQKSPTSKKSNPERANSHLDENRGFSDDARVITAHDNKKLSRKEKEKKRRKAEKAVGVWTMPSDGHRITTGNGFRTAFVTVDLEDEGFRRALVPSPRPAQNSRWSKEFSSSPLALERNPTPQPSNDSSLRTPKDVDAKRRTDLPSDFSLVPFHSGKSFGISTYIRKGRLHDLINVAYSSQDPTLPNSATLFGFELGPTIGVEKFISMLPNICDALFDFATGLPDPDTEVLNSQWSVTTSLVSQLVSWYLKNAKEEEVTALRDLVKTEITRLVVQVQELALTFIDNPVLTVCWFSVELSARLGQQPASSPVSGCPTGPLKDSVSLLMRLLLQFGFKKTMEPFQDDSGLTESSLAQFPAELWVRLIHVLGHCTAAQEASTQKCHPFWSLLMDALDLRVRSLDSMMSFEISEDAWRIIFSVCALSQFSVHGMTIGQPHLPACWDIVAFALKRIRLTQMPQESIRSPKAASLRRDIDKYVALVTNRCFHLRERWQWRLDDASAMFNQLAEIFRSRKFANLLHEKNDYPRFLRKVNWDLLSVYDPKDTAYTIFLKLIVQAVREDKLYAEGKSSPRVKKLLSMAIPMSSLPFSKTNPPKDEDLPMFYNRISALAVAADLEKGDCSDRILTARSYISFVNADVQSRFAVIRGLTNWGMLMVSRGVTIQVMGDWIEEIAKVTRAEFNPASTTDPSSDELFFVEALLCAVRHIFLSYIKNSRYPEPFLLSRLRPILDASVIKHDGMKEEFGRFAYTLFDARSKALPPPPRPPALPPPHDEDSQDYGVMDFYLENIDWSALDVPSALVAPADANLALKPASDEMNDNNLRQALGIQFKWLIYHFTKKSIEPPPAGIVGDDLNVYTSDCDFWLHIWLSCACVESQSDTWNNTYLGVLDDILQPADEQWVRRVRLSIMFQILRLNPMSYQTMTDRAIEVFLNALVSNNNINEKGLPKKGAMEREYVAFMLSIGGLQHSLLSDVEYLLPARSQESGDYEFSPEEFLELRVPLLRAIFKNMNKSVRKQRDGNLDVTVDNKKYIQMCKNMFSGMRYSLSKLDKTSEKFLEDNDFCHQVLKALKENPDLCDLQPLIFWAVNWSNDLIPPRGRAL